MANKNTSYTDLKFAIASCMNLSSDVVKNLNVTSVPSTGYVSSETTRHLANSAAIIATYTVQVFSTLSADTYYESLLVANVANGKFESILVNTGSPVFSSVTDSTVVIYTVSPSYSSTKYPTVNRNNDDNNLSGGAIAGLTIMSVVVAAFIGFAIYYFYNGGKLDFLDRVMANNTEDRTSVVVEGERNTTVEYSNPIRESRKNPAIINI